MVRHCTQCGKEYEKEDGYEPNDSFCSLECKKEYGKKQTQKYKEEGLCKDCQKELPPSYPFVRCEQCRIDHKRQTKRYREKNKRQRRCVKCGRNLPPAYEWDSTRCPECLEKCRNYNNLGIHATESELRMNMMQDRRSE